MLGLLHNLHASPAQITTAAMTCMRMVPAAPAASCIAKASPQHQEKSAYGI